MFGNGLEHEVIITVLPRVTQELPSMFSSGGIREYEYERLVVWANSGLKENFKSIPGIIDVSVSTEVPTRYSIYVDPRYNLKWVIAEIEGIAKTEEPKEEKKLDGFFNSAYLSGGPVTFSFVSVDETKPNKKEKRKKNKK